MLAPFLFSLSGVLIREMAFTKYIYMYIQWRTRLQTPTQRNELNSKPACSPQISGWSINFFKDVAFCAASTGGGVRFIFSKTFLSLPKHEGARLQTPTLRSELNSKPVFRSQLSSGSIYFFKDASFSAASAGVVGGGGPIYFFKYVSSSFSRQEVMAPLCFCMSLVRRRSSAK